MKSLPQKQPRTHHKGKTLDPAIVELVKILARAAVDEYLKKKSDGGAE